MESLLQWGLDLIVAIQQIHGPLLDSAFRAITFMGDEKFYLLLMPLLLWCVDFGLGARVGIFFLLASYINTELKDLFHQPRPFHVNPSVGLSYAGGYGLPSGHAQSSVVVWGSIANWMRKIWFWIGALALVLLIGFSRIYLGVHFPTDVFAGWIIGIVLLCLYFVIQPKVENWLARSSLGMEILLAMAVPSVLLFIHPTRQTIATLAPLVGVGLGLALTRRYVPFCSRGPLWQRVCRFLVGGIIILALYSGLKAVFPGADSSFYPIFRFIRYFFVGLWASFGGPVLFNLIRLTSPRESRS